MLQCYTAATKAQDIIADPSIANIKTVQQSPTPGPKALKGKSITLNRQREP